LHDPPADPNRLAALLDGHVDDTERDALLSRLAADDDALAAYADAVAVTAELEAEDARAASAETAAGGAKVIPFRAPARRSAWRPGAPLLALAAVLAAVAIGVGTWRMMGRGAGAEDVGAYAAALHGAGVPAGWDPSPWTATRGTGETLAPRARGVRLGARLTDLDASASARDSAAVRQAAADVAAILADLPASGPAASVYSEIGRRAGEPPSSLAPLLARGRRSVARLAGDDAVRLGAWAEAARLAAVARDAAFFRAKPTRDELDRASLLPDLPPSAAAALGRLSAEARAGVPEWPALQSDATELLAAAGS
jgi:hypothetical protein